VSGAALPEDYARALLARLESQREYLYSYPLNLYALADTIGLSIREVTVQGFEGALVRVPNRLRGIIAVRRDFREPGRKRFTIAHEIGHFVLPGHGTAQPICTSSDVEWIQEASKQELAANRFAAELLMPAIQIESFLKREGLFISTVRRICDRYVTSLTAAALKCIEMSLEPCALVISSGGRISQFKPNNSFKYQVTLGRTIRSDTKAFHLLEGGDNSSDSGVIQASAWLDNYDALLDMLVKEDSILLPSYDKIFTILTLPSS